MIAKTLCPLFITCCALSFAPAQNGDNELYIERYQHLAIEEMERSGVPASIKMAQALLESGAGASDLANRANNHFGIKCGGSWSGKTYKKHDDEFTMLGLPKKSCFRRYASAEESFRAHSDFLRNNRRYHELFDYDITDYKRWARGLKQAGYATSPTYHKKLIALIERHDLDRLDRMTAGIPIFVEGDRDEAAGQAAPPSESGRPQPTEALAGDRSVELDYYNDVRCIIAHRRKTVAELAGIMNIALHDILRYNENLESPDQEVEPGMRVYTQPKRRHYRGREKWHQVAPGETMLDISIRYGISLRHLYRRNRMFPGSEPAPDSRIKIRGRRVTAQPVLANTSVPGATDVPAADKTPRLDFEIEGSQGNRVSNAGGSK